MLKVKVYNIKGEAVGEENLDDDIFGIEVKEGLVHQALVSQMNNSRRVLAHAKGRAEVRGGGRKPWKQKGTGRARHGSIRSPLWVGGGVTFGPTKERNFKQKINKKMKRKALLMCLSDRAKSEKVVLIDKLNLEEIKTKKLKEIMDTLPSKGKKTLVVMDKNDKNVIKSAANLSKIKTIESRNLNVLDVLAYDFLLFSTEALNLTVNHFKSDSGKKVK